MSFTCGTYPTPRRASSSGALPVTSSAPSTMWPPSKRRIPTRLLSSVLLPAPLGPMTATTSPGPTEMDTSRITGAPRSEEHTSELQSRLHLVCRLLLEKKKKTKYNPFLLHKKKKKQY